MAHAIILAFVLTIIQLSVAITLEQTIPEDNAPVCPGELLSYKCTTTGNALAWEEGGSGLVTFNSESKNNTTVQGVVFTFLLVEVLPGDPYMFDSTATIPFVTANENGLTISCTDENSILSRNVLVAAHPEDCDSIVSCKVNSNSISEMLSDITITLDSAPSDPMCVVGYIFAFGNESKYVAVGNSLSATFIISKNAGLTYENQEILSVNAENQTGEQSCSFGITKPNGITEVHMLQICEELTMTINLTLEWDTPSLHSDNCLNASQLVWQYKIFLTNSTSTKPYKTSGTFLVVEGLIPSSQYDITIISVLSDLGISGDPLTTNTVLNASCSNTGTSSVLVVTIPSIAFVVGMLFLICGIIAVVTIKSKKANSQPQKIQAELNAKLHQQEKEKQQTELQLVEINAKLDQQEKEKQQTELQLEKLRQENTEIKKIVTVIDERLKELESTKNEKIRELEREIENRDKAIQKLENEKSETTLLLKEQEELIAKLKKELERKSGSGRNQLDTRERKWDKNQEKTDGVKDSDDVPHLSQELGPQNSTQEEYGSDEKDFVRQGLTAGLQFRSLTWEYQYSDDATHSDQELGAQTSTL